MTESITNNPTVSKEFKSDELILVNSKAMTSRDDCNQGKYLKSWAEDEYIVLKSSQPDRF